MIKLHISVIALLALTMSVRSNVLMNGEVYEDLREACNAVNAGAVQGDVQIEIMRDLQQTAVCRIAAPVLPARYSSVTIKPLSGITVKVSADIDGPLIWLDGADHVTIDGGATPGSLTLVNNSRSSEASTVYMSNAARMNTLMRCIVTGASSGTSTGVIVIGGGSERVTITGCDIGASSGAPHQGVLVTSGTSSETNRDTRILSNTIHGVFSDTGVSTAAIAVYASSGWVISGNRIVDSITRDYHERPATCYGIRVQAASGYDSVFITDNHIGPFAVHGSTVRFEAISIDAGTAPCVVRSNTIAGIDFVSGYSSASIAPFCAIMAGSNVSGASRSTIVGNTIGGTAPASRISLVLTGTDTLAAAAALIACGADACEQVSINSLMQVDLSGNASSNTGIAALAVRNNTGQLNVTGNVIGNDTLYGITSSVIGDRGGVTGIAATGSFIHVSDNRIRNLIHRGYQTGTGAHASVKGIHLDLSETGSCVVDANLIANIRNTAPLLSTSVTGLLVTGATNETSSISGNLIDRPRVGSIDNFASIKGIEHSTRSLSPHATTRYFNNMVILGGDTAPQPIMIGIDKAGGSAAFYYNTVRITGAALAGARPQNSFAFRRTSVGIDTTINNIFYNSRTNRASEGSHYAFVIEALTNLTSDYNLLYAPGDGGTMAAIGADNYYEVVAFQSAAWPQFQYMVSKPVSFTVDTGAHLTDPSRSDLDLVGYAMPSIAVDFDGDLRNPGASFIGADEGLANSSVAQRTPASTTQVSVSGNGAVASFTLTTAQKISILVIDLSGRCHTVRTAFYTAGRHEVSLGIDGLAPGVYGYRVSGPSVRLSGRLIVDSRNM